MKRKNQRTGTESETLFVWVNPENKKFIKKKAEKEARSVSSVIDELISMERKKATV